MNGLTEQGRVRPGKVHELEQAEARVDRFEREDTREGVAADDDHLTGFHLSHEVGSQDVECRGFARKNPVVVEFAEAQRPKTARVTYADECRGVHDRECERALKTGECPGQSIGK